MNNKNYRGAFSLIAILLSGFAYADHPSVSVGISSAGPINTISASTLPKGVAAVGLQADTVRNDAFTTEELEGFAANNLEGVHTLDSLTTTSISAAYGITDDLSVMAQLPYIKRKNIREGEIEDLTPEAHTHGDSSGLGDLLVMGQYRFLKRDDVSLSFHFGVKAPTGEENAKDNDGLRFETEFQPSSGSWDYLAGLSVQKESGAVGYFANVLYNETTEGGQSTEIGSALYYNAAITYRLNKEDHIHKQATAHSDDGLQWDFIVELNGEKREKNKISGVSEQHSGGNTLMLSPGIRLSSGGMSGYLSIGIPVSQNQHGVQADIEHRIVAGISIPL